MLRGFQVVVSGIAMVAATILAPAVARAQDPAPQAPVLPLDGDVALITMLIKPDKTADFEKVLAKLKEALNKSEKAERKQQAAGWKVYKSPDQVQGSAVYIFMISPIVKGQEYDITRLIAEVFPVEVQEVFKQYKDAFAGRAIMKLNNLMTMQ
jgi:hypothetical protein